ncbi:MAG: D-2-hydroxyacid dehydrogenase [Eubacteriales bacterium]|nr:D-2-hydroxyacid dehydrogenase [Eubacteriales bacterium]
MKIIVLGSELQQKHKDMIRKTVTEVKTKLCFAKSEEDIPAEFADAEVLYGYGKKTVAQNKNLKWLCVPSAGVEYLLRPGIFANQDCLITNSAGAYGVSIAEHIVMVSLMMMRQMTIVYRKTISGEWGERLPQRSLKDCRITVLGTGDIGRTFAQRAKVFEPKSMVGVCRSGICKESIFDQIYKTEELDEVLAHTDLLVMSLPNTKETQGILSRERLGLLPQGAYIVNVGRGSAIDEEALADSLDAGRLAGAALDVFVTEPLPSDSRLWNTKNLLITPHVAGNLTLGYTLDKNVEMFCEDLIRYMNGQPLTYAIDKQRGY